MKPASIISLVIAVLLIVVGLVSCFIAQNMAKANGEYLFAEDRGADSVYTVDLTDSEISKIELIASKVQVNIYGRQEVLHRICKLQRELLFNLERQPCAQL